MTIFGNSPRNLLRIGGGLAVTIVITLVAKAVQRQQQSQHNERLVVIDPQLWAKRYKSPAA
jgi:hypothetical protein